MKTKEIEFNADDLINSVEEVRDHVTGTRKVALRATKVALPPPAPEITPTEVKQIRTSLHLSQGVFAAYLNVPTVTAISWEKGRRKPSGAALRLLELVKNHPGLLAGK